ncbi:Cys/Met metabolism PLP-dependent enzyme-domain-containing protein [Gorgonomyces haynaldii]|nr:Cys/Met metabolism PLP-dependent enzyme-domain-containing protein [Gorgonomyces haynaldii]
MVDLATKCLHQDQPECEDVSAPMHVSTTFRYPQGYNDFMAVKQGLMEGPADPVGPFHIYSRDTSSTRHRLEQVLGSLEDAYAATYSSGLAAIYALLHHVQPNKILTTRHGYHGSHMTIGTFVRKRETEILYLEDGHKMDELSEGDLIWLESPLNPTGEVVDLSLYQSRPKGVVLAVDSTFAPPPIQYTLKFGVDIAMHSSTKFLGGHSDLLGGVLLTKDQKVHASLLQDRLVLGSVMGNMETWLLLRSLRTLKVRVMQQSKNAADLAQWLSSKSEKCLDVVDSIHHASLPGHEGHEAAKKQGDGWSGVLSIQFKTMNQAKDVCSRLKLFDNATSLGGCESLIEWRAAVDKTVHPALCRVNVGLEDIEDLKADLRQAFLSLN